MSLELPYGLKRLTSGPDSEWYGSYADDAAANAAVPTAVRLQRTVLVGTTEKWWRDGVDDANLITKQVAVNEFTGGDVPTSGSTITLNLSGVPYNVIRGQLPISTSKTVALAFDTPNTVIFDFIITIANVAATLDFGSGSLFQSDDSRFNVATQVLTFTAIGTYLIHGTFDQINWRLEIYGNIIPTNIVQDSTHRFVTDTEKTTWNAKQDALGFTPENIANKATNFSVLNDTKYPTTKAANDQSITNALIFG